MRLEYFHSKTYISICPGCDGIGHGLDSFFQVTSCNACMGRGWVSIQVYKSFEPRYRDYGWLWDWVQENRHDDHDMGATVQEPEDDG